MTLTNKQIDEFFEVVDEDLIESVLKQIEMDVSNGDLTALYELLKYVPEENLQAYLPEAIN